MIVLGLVGVAAALGLVVMQVGVAHHAAVAVQSAADLSALAAATALRDGYPPCDIAKETARRNGATLSACVREGRGVVGVEVTRPVSVTFVTSTSTSARAGPTSAR